MKQQTKQINKKQIKEKVNQKIDKFILIQRTVDKLNEKSVDILNDIVDLKKQVDERYSYTDLLEEKRLKQYKERIEGLLNYSGLSEFTKELQSKKQIDNSVVMGIANLPKELLRVDIQNSIVREYVWGNITKKELLEGKKYVLYNKIGMKQKKIEAEEWEVLSLCYGLTAQLNVIKKHEELLKIQKHKDKFLETYEKFEKEIKNII